jgi:hypothetical protein
MTNVRAFAVDLTERVLSTFLQAFIASFGVGEFRDVGEAKAAAIAAAVAGGAAVLSLLKGVVAGAATGTPAATKTPPAADPEPAAPAAPAVVVSDPVTVEPMED